MSKKKRRVDSYDTLPTSGLLFSQGHIIIRISSSSTASSSIIECPAMVNLSDQIDSRMTDWIFDRTYLWHIYPRTTTSIDLYVPWLLLPVHHDEDTTTNLSIPRVDVRGSIKQHLPKPIDLLLNSYLPRN